jgi:hypothetical protein
MSQQMNFDETNREGPASYSAGYEEVPRYQDHTSGSFGQKLSGQDAGRGPSSGQRLALAIVSILALMLTLFAIVGALFANISPAFAPVLGVMAMFFFIAIMVINVVFNRGR